ncbi:putative membrane protein [Microbacterium sp. HM58-2]|nr:putative membrane protein [Microbacterium sp. HM58-2]
MTLLERARDLATKHVALAVSLSLAILVVLRALYFARFDLPVAFAVLTLTNQATLLITTLALFLVVGLSIVWVLDPGGYVNRAHEAGTPRAIVFGTTIAVTALLPLIYGSFMTPILAALAILGVITLTVVRIRRRRQSKRRPQPRKNRAAWAAGLVSGAIVVTLLGQPWMPSEQITTTSSGEPVVGYIVGEQAGQLLLLDRGRQPVWIKVSSIASREVCEMNPLPPDLRWITTPVYRFGSTPTLVECADA